MTADHFLESKVTRAIDSMKKVLHGLARAMERLEQQMDEVVRLRDEIRRAGRSALSAPPLARSTMPAARKGALKFPITDVRFTWLRNGGAMVTIAHKELNATAPVVRKLKLTPATALALAILADAPLGADGFPKALKIQDLAHLMGDKEGKMVRRHAASERLCRLRDAFADGGLNPFLIERSNASARLLWSQPAAGRSRP